MTQRSILLLGESNVGKTHYGAQLLKRLAVGRSSLRMHGQAVNLDPFAQAMEGLADGLASGHTPSEAYLESFWPVIDDAGRRADLVWPDYGGEQIKTLIADHRIAPAWRDRVVAATDWILLIRLHVLTSPDDIFSRPLPELRRSPSLAGEIKLSDQARLIELLQMLLHFSAAAGETRLCKTPSLSVALSCWDELETPAAPEKALRAALPMFADFTQSVWAAPTVFGLSALEKPLSETRTDVEYSARGPETFGYIVRPDGARDPDLTWPVARLLGSS